MFHTAKERNIEIKAKEWMPRPTRKLITWARLLTFITARLKSAILISDTSSVEHRHEKTHEQEF